jgi:hypothetical protein
MQAGEHGAFVSAIIPCLDEAAAIDAVVRKLFALGLDEVLVVDGGSRDGTPEIASAAGARLVVELRRGYGRACAAGIAAAREDATILAFLDGDGSDDPASAPAIIGPVICGQADFCLASRLSGKRETGSMTPSQVFAGRLAGILMRARYGVRYTDMAPFRAIHRDRLEALGMTETTYGWNLEMQMRAAAYGLRIREVAVRCRRRSGGRSKVSGDWRVIAPVALNLTATFLRIATRLRARQSGDEADKRAEPRSRADEFQIPAEPRIGAERSAGREDGEIGAKEDQENVAPGPFRRVAGTLVVDAEPEIDSEQCRSNPGKAYEQAENERRREAELSEIHQRIHEGEVRQDNVGHELLVYREGGASGHLFRPVVKAVVDAKGQLPQGALKPHAADRHAGRPQPQIDALALAVILPPVHDEQSDARDHQQIKYEQDEILPQPQRIEVSSVRGQEGE